jgi:regulator of sirC expression with transglutaminase-like and TPR domain
LTAGLERFADLVSNDEFDVAEASLLVAQDAYPDLDVAHYLARLDDMASSAGRRIVRDAAAAQKVLALNRYLFDEMSFSGNIDDYYDPRNSYLNQVLERRTGIPLTLSIVYLEVGRRLGLRLKGVSFPGHFLVKLSLKSGQLVLDPFMAGEAQSEQDLRERLAKMLPAGEADNIELERVLEPASSRQIIARMLRNLKKIHRDARRPEQALAVMQRMLLVMPEAAEELRDRGLLYQELECFRPALSDLQNYLRRRPDAPDAEEIRGQLVDLRQACARLN